MNTIHYLSKENQRRYRDGQGIQFPGWSYGRGNYPSEQSHEEIDFTRLLELYWTVEMGRHYVVFSEEYGRMVIEDFTSSYLVETEKKGEVKALLEKSGYKCEVVGERRFIMVTRKPRYE